ncbi:hypothetical protein GH721_09805 [Kriegella sp. EG-1]|nr:hypothetical protein [Flavobacteriaceae bacterium EG-1]
MKLLTYIILIITLLVNSIGLSDLRKNYPLANDNSEITQNMYNALSSISSNDKAILIAYKGAFSTILAKHSKQVKDKKTYFKEGITSLELAVEKDPNNIEIRCLRLGVQENSPKFLKYKSAIPADKQFIIEHYASESSQEIKKFIKGYIKLSKSFNESEKQLF